MDSSLMAPTRIAPKPVCQKYLPVSIELLQGVQLGAGTCALRKRAPSSGDSIEVGSFDEFMDGAFPGLIPVSAGIPAPVIRKSENDVWSHDYPPRC